MAASLLALLSGGTPASAVPESITGKLSKPGYTVVVLAAKGQATSVRARRGRFRLRPPARRVTVHLRSANGRYAGPVVVGRRGGRAIVGLEAGARLGKVTIRRGYATVSRRRAKRWIDPERWARSKRGVPIGARNFGRVRARRSRSTVPGDLDLDGVPDALDIDDDGDLLLDHFERSERGRAAQIEEPGGYLQTKLFLPLHETANANATAL